MHDISLENVDGERVRRLSFRLEGFVDELGRRGGELKPDFFPQAYYYYYY
jgi:hypothetical protein